MAGHAAAGAGRRNQLGFEVKVGGDVGAARDATGHIAVERGRNRYLEWRDAGDRRWGAGRGNLDGARGLLARIYRYDGWLDGDPRRARHAETEFLNLRSQILRRDRCRLRAARRHLDEVTLDLELNGRALVLRLGRLRIELTLG
jgi:hypothetical protein